jgi:hypothetical protein
MENRPRPAARFVILGASNVARAISTIVETARLCHDCDPLEILAAFGHGRSFGLTTRVAGRTLPAILHCRLWDALARGHGSGGLGPSASSWSSGLAPLPTSALVTDIGNDILYGVAPRQIARWVERCVVRLIERGADVAMTRLPLDSIHSLGEVRYWAARTVLFPRCKLELHAALDLAAELDARMVELARTLDVTLVEHERDWYGLDPIHIRMSQWRIAWHRAIGAAASRRAGGVAGGDGLNGSLNARSKPSSLLRWLRLKLLIPDIRWVLGIEQRREQPGLAFSDGTTISAY